jgi:hypothetical protein
MHVDGKAAADDRGPPEEVVRIVVVHTGADDPRRRLLNDLVDVVVPHATAAEHRSKSCRDLGPDRFEVRCNRWVADAWNQDRARSTRLVEVHMRRLNSGHSTPLKVATKLLMVLGLTSGTLLISASPAAADPKCVDVYPSGSLGTTVCTP